MERIVESLILISEQCQTIVCLGVSEKVTYSLSPACS